MGDRPEDLQGECSNSQSIPPTVDIPPLGAHQVPELQVEEAPIQPQPPELPTNPSRASTGAPHIPQQPQQFHWLFVLLHWLFLLLWALLRALVSGAQHCLILLLPIGVFMRCGPM